MIKCIFFALLLISPSCFANYLIGAGISDITGPAGEIGMIGFAKFEQATSGIHTRLRSRAFIIVDPITQKRIVFVSADLGHIFQATKHGVIRELKKRFGDLYTDENVMLSAIHTHSGPGGYGHEIVFNLTTLGFVQENYDAIVNGIVESILIAHKNMQSGEIFINRGDITNASKNRAINAYNNNPENERTKYSYPFDTRMTLLRMQGNSDEIGMINWFALHNVSMGNTNTLISSDNKGYASYLFEKSKNVDYFKHKNFVAAFAQSNEGDVSPNIEKELNDSIENDFKRTEDTAIKQYQKAKELYINAQEKLTGTIDYRHAFIDLSNITIEQPLSYKIQKTSRAALGYSFAAGTTDGPGPLPSWFQQGALTENPFISAITGIVALPTEELKALQAPKPIFLAVGTAIPRAWTVSILPIQLFRIGSLILVAVPGEFTTMAGRRLRQTIEDVFGNEITDVVIAGLANSYSGYVTTEEEYKKQLYEGGFTLFGSKTLEAYQQEFKRLAYDLKYNRKTISTLIPPDETNSQITIRPGVLFDDTPIGKKFGDVIDQPKNTYHFGETATVSFWGGHPNNNLRRGDTFLIVERKEGDHWIKIADDGDWNTIYSWARSGLSYSKITISWTIPQDAQSGEYHIRHFGDYKYGWDKKIYSYEGISKSFFVSNNK